MRINTKKKECANAPIGPFTMFLHCVYGYNIRNELVCSRRDEMHRRSSASEGRFGVAEPEGCASICEGAENQYDDIGNHSSNSPTPTSSTPTSSTPNSSTPSLISMSYDRMGRRVTKNNQRFVYDGYLCIGKIEDSTSIHYSQSPIHCFVWDPTEPIATRPLMWNSSTFQPFNLSTSYYTHDVNKNVSEVIAADGALSAHYEYAPFGAVVAQRGASAAVNPWRFSSEYAEDDTATVYYNYRNYEPMIGRWLSRDFVERNEQRFNMYMFVLNQTTRYIDEIGLTVVVDANSFPGAKQTLKGQWVRAFDDGITNLTIRLIRQSRQDFDKIVMKAVKAICYKKMEDEYWFEKLLGEQHFDTSFQSKWDRYVLVEGEKDVYRGNELNYVGIGLYDAARGAPRSSLLIYIWKRIKYNEKPSKGALYWYYKGYDMLKEKLELLDPCTCEEKR